MLHLYLLRHAQTDASRARRFSGTIDAQLSEIGHRMAAAFAEAYAELAWDAIYCSPQQRARDTAAPLARLTHLPLQVDEDLREIAYGSWEGLLEDDVQAQWPDEYARWAADPATRSVPGGETGLQVAARAMAAIERIRRTHTSGRVLVVSHKTTLRVAVCALAGIDLRRFRDRIAQQVTGLTQFDIDGAQVLLRRLGDVSHLPPELRDLPGS